MKKNLYILSLAISLLLTSVVIADDAPKSDVSGAKIAYVDIKKVCSMENLGIGCDEWKDRYSELQKNLQSKATETAAKDERRKQIAKELEAANRSSVLTPEARSKKAEELAKLNQDIKFESEMLNYNFQEGTNGIYGEIMMQVEKVTKEIAQRKGLDIVFAGPVLFYSSRVDITDEVIAELNKQYKAKKFTKKSAPSNGNNGNATPVEAAKTNNAAKPKQL